MTPETHVLTPLHEVDVVAAPYVCNAFGERYLHAVNRSTFATLGSEAVFRQHFGNKLEDEDTLSVVIGCDSGLLVEHLQRQGVAAGSRFLFIELPDVLARIEARLGDLTLDPRIKITSPDAWHQHAMDFSLDSYAYINRLRILNSVGAADAFIAGYRLLHRHVKADLDAWMWSLRSTLQSSYFIDRQLRNAAEAHNAAVCLKDSFPGCTAVLLGGGPSLDEILPWVQQHRDEVVVIAVSRICRRLLDDGVTPDIVCTIDPTALSFDVSKDMLKLPDDVLLVSAYHAHPPLISQWNGRHVFLGARVPWNSALNITNLGVVGPTVTNTALALAVEMGFSQLILGGVDLCFSADGHSHAQGSNERLAGPALGHMGPLVETNSGDRAETTDALQQAVNDIAAQAQVAQARGCRIINPARHAARIPHVLHQTLDAVALSSLDQNPRDTLGRLLPVSDAEARLRHYRALDKDLAATEHRVRRIRELAGDALHCNDGLFGRNGETADFKYKLRMDSIEKRLEKEFQGLAELVKRYGITAFLRVIRPDRDREWTDAEIETTGRIYYEAYRDGATKFLDTLAQTRKLVAARMTEDAARPDVLQLVDAWRQHDEAGRVRVWRQRRPDQAAALSAAAAAAMAETEAVFRAVLEAKDTPHMARCKAESELRSVPSKATWLFQHKDLAGLRRLLSGLEERATAGDSAALWLTRGYVAELEERPQDALADYQNIQDGPALEDALRRITALSLAQADYANAMLALECLGHLSASFLPQYAELLRLSGEAQRAAETYVRYLEQVPDDLAAMLKLGQLYLEQGVQDGARWAFEYVLERFPDNLAARSLLQTLDTTREQRA